MTTTNTTQEELIVGQRYLYILRNSIVTVDHVREGVVYFSGEANGHSTIEIFLAKFKPLGNPTSTPPAEQPAEVTHGGVEGLKVVVTCNMSGQCVCVSRQDPEGRIHEVIWEAEQPAEGMTDVDCDSAQHPSGDHDWHKRMHIEWKQLATELHDKAVALGFDSAHDAFKFIESHLASKREQPATLQKCDGDHAEIIPCADPECWHKPAPAQELPLPPLMIKAQGIVESKFVFRKFIDGTPLQNDVAVWMAEFARDTATQATAALRAELLEQCELNSWPEPGNRGCACRGRNASSMTCLHRS